MARNPLISLQGVLLPINGVDYRYRAEVLTSFQRGSSFNHHLRGKVQVCSIWDFAVGDMVKFSYDDEHKSCFYRVTKSDFMKDGGA